MEDTKKLLEKAQTHMLLYAKFWGVQSLQLELKQCNKLPTGATNGKALLYNDNFVQSLDDDKRAGFVAHEVGHCILKHHIRLVGLDRELGNKAADYELNPMLLEAGFKLPDGFLYDRRFDGMSLEQIYNVLADEQQKDEQDSQDEQEDGTGEATDDSEDNSKDNSDDNPQDSENDEDSEEENDSEDSEDSEEDDSTEGGENAGDDDEDSEEDSDNTSGGNDDSETGDSGDESGEEDYEGVDPAGTGGVIACEDQEEAEEEEAKWTESTLQASKMGDLPAGMERYIDEILHPKVSWTKLLEDFFELNAKSDYSWNRINKRYLVNDIILPSLYSNELDEVVIYVDTSISMTQDQLAQTATEVSDVLSNFDTTVRVIYVDSKFQGEEVFEPEDLPLTLHAKGGGGTDFRPAFEYVEQKGYTPSCAIFFTDLEGRFPEREPDYPVLWVKVPHKVWGHNSLVAPFGETIKM